MHTHASLLWNAHALSPRDAKTQFTTLSKQDRYITAGVLSDTEAVSLTRKPLLVGF
jgi:hypothetical protein